jgi:hypothetical protein
MAEAPSYVGPGIAKYPGKGARRERMAPSRRAPIMATMAIAALLFSVLVYVVNPPESDKATKSLSVTTLAIALSFQHYDTGMPCVAPPPVHPIGPHAWNDAKGINGVYGDADDCPHCSAYCAPASISMITTYRGLGAPANVQDAIYDNGKSVLPEITGDNIIQTHGVGMFHGVGVWPAEVQTAMTWAMGPIIQYDSAPANPKGPMTYPLLLGYMGTGTPILWLDNGGWPVNQSASYPSLSNRVDQGHAKVIGGHDDNNTPLDPTDDLCLIYDPWPEYIDMGILPLNCTQGPGGTWDPYWQPLNDVNFSDPNDVYLVDTFPAIPEFVSVFVPVIGIMAIAMTARCFARRDSQD